LMFASTTLEVFEATLSVAAAADAACPTKEAVALGTPAPIRAAESRPAHVEQSVPHDARQAD